jgi:hypothetical protein
MASCGLSMLEESGGASRDRLSKPAKTVRSRPGAERPPVSLGQAGGRTALWASVLRVGSLARLMSIRDKGRPD